MTSALLAVPLAAGCADGVPHRTHTLALAATLFAATLSMASAETFTQGIVKKIDVQAGKVTIIHDELVDLDMPAMTMVFRVAEAAMLETLSEGEEIEFVAARVDGKLTVTKLQQSAE